MHPETDCPSAARRAVRFLVLIALAAPAFALARGQEDRGAAVERRVHALERMVNEGGEDSLRAFADEHVAPAWRDADPQGVPARLVEVRAACRSFGGIGVERQEGGLALHFETGAGEWEVSVDLEDGPPHRITGLRLAEAEPRAWTDVGPLTWDNVGAVLDGLEADGFSGHLLLIRDDEVVLDRPCGLADPAAGTPVTADTAFAVGSVPIDFTEAAVLKLVDEGKLSRSDPIAEHLDGVPEDKRAITVEHLLQGTSGLQNFHGIPGVDADLDLAWIDRAEALRRILAQPLLFAPGAGQAHSHSAWGLLAAIVEVVSGKSYGDFLRERFLEPASMTRTGLYEGVADFPEEQLAVGVPPRRPDGAPNSPAHWGRTSWLVLGSGGMVSSPRDLRRFVDALRGGLLSEEAQRAFFTGGDLLAGGNDRGFLCAYTDAPRTRFFLCSNSHVEVGDAASALARALHALVSAEATGRWRFGVVFDLAREEDGARVVLQSVVPGGAAARAGLRAGDRLLALDGEPLPADPGPALRALGATPDPVTFAVERAGERFDVAVRPDRPGEPVD